MAWIIQNRVSFLEIMRLLFGYWTTLDMNTSKAVKVAPPKSSFLLLSCFHSMNNLTIDLRGLLNILHTLSFWSLPTQVIPICPNWWMSHKLLLRNSWWRCGLNPFSIWSGHLYMLGFWFQEPDIDSGLHRLICFREKEREGCLEDSPSLRWWIC